MIYWINEAQKKHLEAMGCRFERIADSEEWKVSWKDTQFIYTVRLYPLNPAPTWEPKDG